jgi:hypothetical protein
MFPSFEGSKDILVNAVENELYPKLIEQLNKDFSLANFNFQILENSAPVALKNELTAAIKNLINTDFTTFNALLYIADVSEENLQKIDSSNIDLYSEQITFLLLKRVWKKVWFRANYSN